MNQYCEWLHQVLEALPMFSYPYPVECIPMNGVYFQNEAGETYGQEITLQRIVRIGSHTGQGNLPDRLSQHYSPRDSWIDFNIDHPKAADRSVFRKHLGRTYLNQVHDPYLTVSNIDFTQLNKSE